MIETTLSYRIRPPLYGLNGGQFDIPKVAGIEPVRIQVTLVDTGQPTIVKAAVTGSGSITVPGDDLGMLHNTRLDVVVPGRLGDWMMRAHEEPLLTTIANRLIDWYRVAAHRPTVRRIPRDAVKGFTALDSNGRHGLSMLGHEPGTPSRTAGTGDASLIASLGEVLSTRGELPLWVALYVDALAEFQSGELRVAILLANASMETLIQAGFRAVASDEEIIEAFAGRSETDVRPWSFWKLLTRLNALISTGRETKDLTRLASTVNRQRDDVSHGNPVELTDESVGAAITALDELVRVLDPAIVAHLLGQEA